MFAYSGQGTKSSGAGCRPGRIAGESRRHPLHLLRVQEVGAARLRSTRTARNTECLLSKISQKQTLKMFVSKQNSANVFSETMQNRSK